MKTKIFSAAALFLCVCVLLCSCASALDTAESFCISIEKFNLEKAEGYVSDDAEKYFENVLKYESKLSDEQKEIAKKLYSYVKFSDISENGDGTFTVATVKHIDFAALIVSVDINLATGTESASDYISDMMKAETFSQNFVRTKNNVKITVTETDGDYKLVLGYSGDNKEFTALLGLDTFLRWYSTKR